MKSLKVRTDTPEHVVIDFTAMDEQLDDLTAAKMDSDQEWDDWVHGVLTLWSHWLEKGTD